MKEILTLIEEKKRAYSQSLFFKFLRDESIHPRERLAFVPCSTPFILGFTDLCKYVLRQEPTNSKVQAIINQHTYEDEEHWLWFLEDMENLGFNYSIQLNDALRFLWCEKTSPSRLITYQLYQYIAQSNTIEKLVILEALEGFADIFLSTTKKVTDELQLVTNREYKYFGNCHYDAENEHHTHSEDIHQFVANLSLSLQDRERSIELVHKLFELFSQWNHELLVYARTHQLSQPLNSQSNEKQLLEAAY